MDKGSNEPPGNQAGDTDNRLGDLLANLPFEKPRRDFSGSILQKLKEPSKAYNPYWEMIYLLVVFCILALAAYLFVKVDDTDIAADGGIKTISGLDKLVIAFIVLVAATVTVLFISRYQRFKKRMAEIKNGP